MQATETLSHRLIVPADANHYGTLYAGALLRLALEAAYATGFRAIGQQAHLVLRRVVELDCLEPVPVGSVIEIRGAVLQVGRASLDVGLVGTPLDPEQRPWMRGLLNFVQVDQAGKPATLPQPVAVFTESHVDWDFLRDRLQKLRRVR